MLWLAPLLGSAAALTQPPTALLRPLSAEAKLQQLSGLLVGSAVLQDPRAWELLKEQEGSRFAEISSASRVDSSSRHGLGLFAARDLPAGTVASFFPVHSIGLLDQRLASNADDQEYWKTCTKAYQTEMLHAAVQDFAPGTYVDVNLEKPEQPGWLAHRANDATACAGRCEEDVLSYLHTCMLECNTLLLPFGGAAPILALVTTRDVAEGEELLRCHGLEHWAENNSVDGDDAPVDELALTPAARECLEAFRKEQERADRLDALAQAYQDEVSAFEGMIVLAADDMSKKQADGESASASDSSAASQNRKMRRSTKKASPSSRGGSKKKKKAKRKK